MASRLHVDLSTSTPRQYPTPARTVRKHQARCMLRLFPTLELNRMTKRPLISTLALTAAMAVSACGGASDQTAPPPATTTKTQAQAPAIVQPGAPGQASTTVASVPAFHDNNFTDDDVKF